MQDATTLPRYLALSKEGQREGKLGAEGKGLLIKSEDVSVTASRYKIITLARPYFSHVAAYVYFNVVMLCVKYLAINRLSYNTRD